MQSGSLFRITLGIIFAQLLLLEQLHAAPSSVSYADDSGAFAGAGNGDTGTIAFAGPSGAVAGPSGPSLTTGAGSGSTTVGQSPLLLSRSGGSSSPSQSKMQSVVVGSNGDTTILQQNGDQPAKVYKISGSG